MNKKALKVLEYNKIIDRLCEYAGSAPGKERCRRLEPLCDLEKIRESQRETTDALSRIYKKGSLSFSGVPEIRESIKRLEIASALGAGELLKISSVMTAAARVKSYGRTTGVRDNVPEDFTDSLSERFNLLEPMTNINNEIQRCIISEEEIADDASAGLKNVRRRIKQTNDKIHDQLSSIINSQNTKLMLQDSLVTMRDGRYCIPVKSEYKSQVSGMVHDQSSSGSTVFIEPMAVVKLNNELRELELKEKEEIEKILQMLSAMLYGETENLKFNVETLAEFDFIFARAQLSKDMKASEPEFNEAGIIEIRKARHPLIDKHKVVPIDIRLGGEFDLLVITGPNTGGKTVSLKTVGLLTLMGQAGLHIPAVDGSKLSIFTEVYADIGDEQSIEQSLSTFSSHMTNTVGILEAADEHSLVLFDELGAGTDPTEGAALAMAILTYLHNKNVHCMATTHYSELKVYALSTPGVCNACCEFDIETLSPTYRLLIGIPGKSNAFAISSKLGLRDDVIEMARSFIGTKDKSFEDLMAELEKNRVETENSKLEAEKLLRDAESIKQKYEQQQKKLDESREKQQREAKEEAYRILQEAKDYADETIRKFNKLGAGMLSGKELEQERSALREKLDATGSSLTRREKQIKKKDKKNPEELKVGDAVFVSTLNLEGKISTLPNAKGDMYVQMGALRALVNIKDIELIEELHEEKQEKHRSGQSEIKIAKSMSVSTELNIIGMRVDEALPELDKYLDDAYLAHLPRVTIIHGRGTGALRDAVHHHLRRTKYVETYRLGGHGEGDGGATIVEFKQ